MRCGFAWAVLGCLTVCASAWGQEPTRIVTMPQFAALRDSVDETAVATYFDQVEAAIGKIAAQYPQLADWGRPKGPAWWDPGLRRTPKRIEYAHAVLPGPPFRGMDSLGENGFMLDLRVLSEREMAVVAGRSIDAVVFGAPLGGGYVIAQLSSDKPRNVELEGKVAEIMRRPLLEGR